MSNRNKCTHPNRTMTPYISKIMPIMGQRTNIRKSPRTKQIVPLKLLTFVNTLQVDCQPSKRPTPINQNKFPRASKPLSKYKMTPRNVKDKPKPMRPNPTSANIQEMEAIRQRKMKFVISITDLIPKEEI